MMEVEFSGSVDFSADVDGQRTDIRNHDVLCVLKLMTNLLSVSELTKREELLPSLPQVV